MAIATRVPKLTAPPNDSAPGERHRPLCRTALSSTRFTPATADHIYDFARSQVGVPRRSRRVRHASTPADLPAHEKKLIAWNHLVQTSQAWLRIWGRGRTRPILFPIRHRSDVR